MILWQEIHIFVRCLSSTVSYRNSSLELDWNEKSVATWSHILFEFIPRELEPPEEVRSKGLDIPGVDWGLTIFDRSLKKAPRLNKTHTSCQTTGRDYSTVDEMESRITMVFVIAIKTDPFFSDDGIWDASDHFLEHFCRPKKLRTGGEMGPQKQKRFHFWKMNSRTGGSKAHPYREKPSTKTNLEYRFVVRFCSYPPYPQTLKSVGQKKGQFLAILAISRFAILLKS